MNRLLLAAAGIGVANAVVSLVLLNRLDTTQDRIESLERAGSAEREPVNQSSDTPVEAARPVLVVSPEMGQMQTQIAGLQQQCVDIWASIKNVQSRVSMVQDLGVGAAAPAVQESGEVSTPDTRSALERLRDRYLEVVMQQLVDAEGKAKSPPPIPAERIVEGSTVRITFRPGDPSPFINKAEQLRNAIAALEAVSNVDDLVAWRREYPNVEVQ